MRKLFSFPNPVNDISARIVASGVVLMAFIILAFRQYWVLIPLAYGFLARVASGPRFSPLGLFATKVLTPRIPTQGRLLPGPPKRFAQAIGATMSTAALIAYYGFGLEGLTLALIGGLMFAAFLEAAMGLCLGCVIFNGLIKLNLIPEKICLECADITRRLGQTRT
jgi:hypothetical protein